MHSCSKPPGSSQTSQLQQASRQLTNVPAAASLPAAHKRPSCSKPPGSSQTSQLQQASRQLTNVPAAASLPAAHKRPSCSKPPGSWQLTKHTTVLMIHENINFVTQSMKVEVLALHFNSANERAYLYLKYVFPARPCNICMFYWSGRK